MNELYLKLLSRAIDDYPEEAASLLIPHIPALKEERERLLLRILQQPLTFNSIVEIVQTLQKAEVPLDQREELIRSVLSKPVSDDILQEVADFFHSEGLSKEQHEALLAGMLSELPEKDVLQIPELLRDHPLTQEQRERFSRLAFTGIGNTEELDLSALVQSIPLTLEQRLEMLGALLSEKPQENFTVVCHDHRDYLRDIQRNMLWDILLDYPLDKERRNGLLDRLLQYPFEKEQREKLRSTLLVSAPEKEQQMMISELLDKYSPEETQREQLWNILFKASTDREKRRIVTGLLENCSPEAEERDRLWGILIEAAPERESRKRITGLLETFSPEKEQREKLWQILSTVTPEKELRQVLPGLLERFSPDKEQRERLWDTLLAASPGKELRQVLPGLLERFSPDKEQREMLWNTLLAASPEKEISQKISILLDQYTPEKEQREKLWGLLSEYSMTNETLARFSKPLFTAVSRGNLPSELQILQKIAEYRRVYKQLYPWIDPETERWKTGKTSAYERIIEQDTPVSEVLLDMICEENICHLKGADMEFLDRKQLWIMIEELLLQESYAFPIEGAAPRILDCGVNIGLALYYMKQRWPDAKIIGFEPWKIAYECALRNIERNHWENIELHNSALSAEAGTQEMTVIRENSTAATLTHRLDDLVEKKRFTADYETVPTETLSSYLDEPTELLKIDIEGMEGAVINEARDRLENVRYLFCEHHYSQNDTENSLAGILTVLEQGGFAFQTDRALRYREMKPKAGMAVGKNNSTFIWAVRDKQDK